jgi:hypothetical protein
MRQAVTLQTRPPADSALRKALAALRNAPISRVRAIRMAQLD